ncbi:hypothetical protein DFH08DRAFT_852403 [Mycena albidolilacea]|uniref:Secreted protein n=1 Tax=Mycena albidolilacea TaxID=1033008 RepID=A0AAD7ADV3_9AGAR|nr:hypothetical protein DFH08DRAFT_852403 [Mycena albidolilacea]
MLSLLYFLSFSLHGHASCEQFYFLNSTLEFEHCLNRATQQEIRSRCLSGPLACILGQIDSLKTTTVLSNVEMDTTGKLTARLKFNCCFTPVKSLPAGLSSVGDFISSQLNAASDELKLCLKKIESSFAKSLPGLIPQKIDHLTRITAAL